MMTSLPQIDFADIEETSPPRSKTEGPRAMTVVLRGGCVRVLPVTRRHGPNAKFRDVYSFNMFLRGIVRHQSQGRRFQAESDQAE